MDDTRGRSVDARIRTDGGNAGAPCAACGDAVSDALARTVRLTVDRAEVDSQRLCPDCFAEWYRRYEREMATDSGDGDDGDGIIVD